jgi:hypothetical protein
VTTERTGHIKEETTTLTIPSGENVTDNRQASGI